MLRKYSLCRENHGKELFIYGCVSLFCRLPVYLWWWTTQSGLNCDVIHCMFLRALRKKITLPLLQWPPFFHHASFDTHFFSVQVTNFYINKAIITLPANILANVIFAVVFIVWAILSILSRHVKTSRLSHVRHLQCFLFNSRKSSPVGSAIATAWTEFDFKQGSCCSKSLNVIILTKMIRIILIILIPLECKISHLFTAAVSQICSVAIKRLT